MTEADDTQQQHKSRMRKVKQQVDERIANARRSGGLIICLYGDGKGKSSSAFGTLCRCLGHRKRGGVVQFIKGQWKTGESEFFSRLPEVEYHCMNSGFTWETQNREQDLQAAETTWRQAEKLLQNEDIAMVILDEIHYMLEYQYLPEEQVLTALRARPPRQHVILTGRPAIPALFAIADTVSEVTEIKHAFHAGFKAQKGVEW